MRRNEKKRQFSSLKVRTRMERNWENIIVLCTHKSNKLFQFCHGEKRHLLIFEFQRMEINKGVNCDEAIFQIPRC